MTLLSHPAWIEVDLDALAHNARVLRRCVPDATRLGILVKANGYGHGMEMAARAALEGGADQLIVATVDEGLALRRAGMTAPVLVVYAIPLDALGDAVEQDLEVSVTGRSWADRLLDAWAGREASPGGRPLRLHVEVDTGMGRGGVAPGDLARVVELIDRTPGTELAGIWSHLADGSDAELSREQSERFEQAVAGLRRSDRPLAALHIAATEALFAATAQPYDMVRIGLGFYGSLGLAVEPAPSMAAAAADLRHAMSVKARPVRLETMPAGSPVGYGREWVARRESRIATLPIGYADGWTRAYSPGAQALVRGTRVPLVGRVSMDSVCADVTDVPGVTHEDEFVLLGEQGGERISVEELARIRRSIPNEVFCAFGGRLRRVYLRGGEVEAGGPLAVGRTPGTRA